MNSETTPLVEACITCISLEANDPIQEALQATCSEILDTIAGYEMVFDQESTDHPEIEE
jgi:hypothetical protein